MAMVQMNVRMDAALKEGGDWVFARLGYTPTEVVRLVWSFANQGGDDVSKVKRLLDDMGGNSKTEVEADDETNRRMDAARRALGSWGIYFNEWEIARPESPKNLSEEEYEAALARQIEEDRQLLEDALAERYGLEVDA